MHRPTLWYKFRPSRVIEKDGLLLTSAKERVLWMQSEGWEREYLPTFSVKGKKIMLVGAGCGETLLFYLKHGAREFIAIECNRTDLRCLRENAKRRDWKVEIIGKPFKLSHLRKDFDLCQMDIEGAEIALFDLKKLDFPIILESHSESITARLVEKFPGLKVKCKTVQNLEILSNCG